MTNNFKQGAMDSVSEMVNFYGFKKFDLGVHNDKNRNMLFVTAKHEGIVLMELVFDFNDEKIYVNNINLSLFNVDNKNFAYQFINLINTTEDTYKATCMLVSIMTIAKNIKFKGIKVKLEFFDAVDPSNMREFFKYLRVYNSAGTKESEDKNDFIDSILEVIPKY